MNYTFAPGSKLNERQYSLWMEELRNHRAVFHKCLVRAVEVASPMPMDTAEEKRAKRAVEASIATLSSYLGFWNPLSMREAYERQVILGGLIEKTYGPNSLEWSFAFKYLFLFVLATKLDSEFQHKEPRLLFARKEGVDKQKEKRFATCDGLMTTKGLEAKVCYCLEKIEQRGK